MFSLAVCAEMVFLDLPFEERVRRIAESGFQVADVPGRCEPGTGEINFAAIAAALKDMGYRGTVGLEAYASGDDNVALERFSAVFGAGTSAQQQPSDD
jgi:hydroxypyruvate isomerase